VKSGQIAVELAQAHPLGDSDHAHTAAFVANLFANLT
jgi:hypothetical protein